ncbi:hypothetical protein [Asanoa siamensis]|uniref:Lipoprotein n=1 Tax=Asanoa siamensis TaxID=926357 RepID=A0ABQ4CVC0_9ACTN|nr:hypothetical protein [Asanoa siamensis]GIF75226.1 hypothetical protein Asi02nite_47440 [Asanoa siamensis]
MRLARLVPLLLVAGCTSAPSPPSPPPSSFSAAPSPDALRDCESSVKIGAAPVGLVRAGPVALVPLDYRFGSPLSPPARDPDPDGYRRFKIALLLRAGTAATLTIPGPYRDRAKLTYANGSDHTVRFAACPQSPDGDSDFAGGFAIREPLCLPLDITSNGQTWHLRLEFGADTC